MKIEDLRDGAWFVYTGHGFPAAPRKKLHRISASRFRVYNTDHPDVYAAFAEAGEDVREIDGEGLEAEHADRIAENVRREDVMEILTGMEVLP